MEDFSSQCPKFFTMYRIAASMAETRPASSQVVISGLRNIIRSEGFTEFQADEIFILAGTSLILDDAKEFL